MDNFDPLIHQVEALCKSLGASYAGALLRPHGESMPALLKKGSRDLEAVFAAAFQAGRKLIMEGEMQAEILERVSRTLVPKDKYLINANRYFQKLLDKKNNTTKH